MRNNQYTLNFINILILTLVNYSNQINPTSLVFPMSLQLLDNTNAVISLDGIHFYDSAFENEDETKFLSLNIPESQIDNIYKGIFMAQFPTEYDEYIIIFVPKIIYIFDKNKNKLKEQDISQNMLVEKIFV